MSNSLIHFLGDKNVINSANMKDTSILDAFGEKGVKLSVLSQGGVPIPFGFVINSSVCKEFNETNPPNISNSVWDSISKSLKQLEASTKCAFGSEKQPLLLSCRASFNSPCFYDPVLNIGLNDVIVKEMINGGSNSKYVWDSYRRLIQSYSVAVFEISNEAFVESISGFFSENSISNIQDASAEDLETLVGLYKEIVNKIKGVSFPQDPKEQLLSTINAFYGNWNSEKANDYKKLFGVIESANLPLLITQMANGNISDSAGSGVVYSRNPMNGESSLIGEFIPFSEGNDITLGFRPSEPLSKFEEVNPDQYSKLIELTKKVESLFSSVQEISFVYTSTNLFVLQSRGISMSGTKYMKVLSDMVDDGIMDKEQALKQIDLDVLTKSFVYEFDSSSLKSAQDKKIGQGTSVSEGVISGPIYYSSERAVENSKQSKGFVFLTTSLSDIQYGILRLTKGLICNHGSFASKLSSILRIFNIPSVFSCDFSINDSKKEIKFSDYTIKEGEIISIDSKSGFIYKTNLSVIESKSSSDKEMGSVIKWIDEVSIKKDVKSNNVFNVYMNCNIGSEADQIKKLGVSGIGIFRMESAFVGERSNIVQRYLLSADDEERDATLQEMEEAITSELAPIVESLPTGPVYIRLFDSSLSSFLPDPVLLSEEIAGMKEKVKLEGEVDEEEMAEKEKLLAKIRELMEQDPAFGQRGVRICLLRNNFLAMQIRCIIDAAAGAQERGSESQPNIVIPFAISEIEISSIRPKIEKMIIDASKERDVKLKIGIGASIDLPRAVFALDRIVDYCDFVLFGFDSLVQFYYGIEKEGSSNSIIKTYIQNGVFSVSPYESIDEMEKMITTGIKKVQTKKPQCTIGLFTDNGLAPNSIVKCQKMGLTFVSGPANRYQMAKISAALAVLKENEK